MQREQIRQVITAQFYQSIAESNVQVRSIPQNELQAIVNALADGVFAALEAMEDEVTASRMSTPVASAMPAAGTGSSAAPGGEQLLWRGRPYLSIGTVYEVTTQRIRILRGIFGHTLDEIELVRVRDTRVKQHLGERMLNVGDITIFSADENTPELVLNNVQNPVEVRELIRKAVLEERARRGLVYREVLEDNDQSNP